METIRLAAGLKLATSVATLIAVASAPAAGQATTRASVVSGGIQAGSGSYPSWISADGRFVGFRSGCNTLVPGDQYSYDVFVHDRQTLQTTRVSLSTSGGSANGDSHWGAISADGRYVAFWSYASNIVAGDTNSVADVFVYDRQTAQSSRVSVSSAGVGGNQRSAEAAMSYDGRYVVFETSASNLVPGDTDQSSDIVLRDRQLGVTTLVSVDSNGVHGNAASRLPAISGDGRYVAFESVATNLVIGDTNGVWDVFVRDLQTGQTTLESVDSAGVAGNGNSCAGMFSGSYRSASLSSNGRMLAFYSSATNLVPGDTNNVRDVFVRDRQLGTTLRASVDSAGAQANSYSEFPMISGNGRYVVFQSKATNLVPGAPNNSIDVFVHDLQTGQTVTSSVDSAGVDGNDNSTWPSITDDGRFVSYSSWATNLVPNDTNGGVDVFVRDGTHACYADVDGDGYGDPLSVVYTYGSCAGSAVSNGLDCDDTNASVHPGGTEVCNGLDDDCNGLIDDGFASAFCTAGTTTNGCVASISGTGTASASAPSGFTIGVAGVEGQKQGLVFYGIDNSSYTPVAWGATSYLCVKSPLQRTSVQSSGGTVGQCDGVLALDWNAYRAANPSALGAPFSVGQQVFAQGWFRDPGSVKTTNLSNALQFALCP